MKRNKTYSAVFALAGLLLAGLVFARPANAASANRVTVIGPAGQEPVYQDLPKPGKKCWIGEDFYFVYGFDKTPKMGTSILKIELFGKDGKRITDWNISARSDMPSMRGAHDSGEVAFKQNRQGDYLIPVNIVMPGDWEVLLTFSKDEAVVFRGRVAFDV